MRRRRPGKKQCSRWADPAGGSSPPERWWRQRRSRCRRKTRSEEHTSELQSPCNLVCRLLLEKKNKQVSSHIVDVQRGAGETGSGSSAGLAAAHSRSGDSNRLKLEVGKFLNSVRAS